MGLRLEGAGVKGVWVGGVSISLLDIVLIQYAFMNNCCLVALHVSPQASL
jgi:hypothetical protein